MKRIIDSFFTTFMLVSRIPVKRTIKLEYSYTVFFLPLIGVVTTAVLTVTGLVGSYFIRDGFIVAIVILFVQYCLFNMFHFDGLLDSADALFVFADRRKRLDILKDVKIGSFAFFIGAMYLSAKIYLVFRCYSVAIETANAFSTRLVLLYAIPAYAVSGRAAAAFIPTLLKPARSDGLGVLLADSRFHQALLGTVVSFAFAAVPLLLIDAELSGFRWAVLFGFLAIPVSVAVTVTAFRRKIGGYTGDTLGLAVELGELFHLLLCVVVLGYAL